MSRRSWVRRILGKYALSDRLQGGWVCVKKSPPRDPCKIVPRVPQRRMRRDQCHAPCAQMHALLRIK
jgi:hypothetical protein